MPRPPAFKAALQVAFATAVLAGLWTACTTDPDPVSPPQATVMVRSRVLSVPNGSSDTTVTLLRYDSSGILTREIRSTTYREWDSLGRYKGVRIKDSARYVEQLEWIGADSAVRRQGTSIVIRERYFNPRANCWCADSIRHTIFDSIVVIRKFQFDDLGNPLVVTLTSKKDGHTEIAQTYENHYDDNGRLMRILVQDAEAGFASTRFLEYDTLKNVTESRSNQGSD